MDIADIIRKIVVLAPSLLFAITLHEMMHGWAAEKFGDKTARMLGRITLNPVKHIDLWGTIILPIAMFVFSNGLFLFGWAKPVPVNQNNLRNPKRDMAFVALAGPMANLLMAIICATIVKLCYILYSPALASNPWILATITYLINAARVGIVINILLMVLNLLPIPPLDGSRVVSSLLPTRLSMQYNRLEPYGIWILLGLFMLEQLGVLRVLTWFLFTPVYYLSELTRQLFGI